MRGEVVKKWGSWTLCNLWFPETQRRISVKDQDLSGQLSNEKALRICLETGDDALNFKINLNEKPLTKSLMLKEPVYTLCMLLFWAC